MKENLKNYVKKCHDEGTKVEDLFIESIGNAVAVKSSDAEDIKNAWDYVIETCENYPLLNNQLIDVKGIKSKDTSHNYLEFIGYDSENNQKVGWLFRGKADLIAFEREDYFFVVKKEDLIKLAKERVPAIREAFDTARNKFLQFGSQNRGWYDYLLFELQQVREQEKTPIIWKKVEKENALNEILYSRYKSGSPDLMMRILTTDLEEFSILKIEKNNTPVFI